MPNIPGFSRVFIFRYPLRFQRIYVALKYSVRICKAEQEAGMSTNLVITRNLSIVFANNSVENYCTEPRKTEVQLIQFSTYLKKC